MGPTAARRPNGKSTLSLSAYCAQVQTPADLATPPLLPPGLSPKPIWHWKNVATSTVDRALEPWFWGLASYGQPIAVRAAAQMVGQLFPVWDAGVKTGGEGMPPLGCTRRL